MNICIVGRFLEDDCRLTVAEIASAVGISYGNAKKSLLMTFFQYETLSCCTTMPGRIQLSKLDKKLRPYSELYWNSLPTVRSYCLVITICLDH